MAEALVYNAYSYIHILSMTGWVALISLSTVLSSRVRSDVRYCFKLVALESALGLALVATGLLLASQIGFPVWTHMALGLALIASILQAVRLISAYRAVSRGDITPLARNSRWAPHALGLIFLIALYLMVFKPFS